MQIMWPSLVKILYTELKLSCGNDPGGQEMIAVYIYFFSRNDGLIYWEKS